jgi:hypothetical protein
MGIGSDEGNEFDPERTARGRLMGIGARQRAL